MDRIGRTIKSKVFQQVKWGRIADDSLKDFAMHASRLIQSIIRLYLQKKNTFEELARIEDAEYIKGTLDVHKVKRKEMKWKKLSRRNFPGILLFIVWWKTVLLIFIENQVIR